MAKKNADMYGDCLDNSQGPCVQVLRSFMKLETRYIIIMVGSLNNSQSVVIWDTD